MSFWTLILAVVVGVLVGNAVWFVLIGRYLFRIQTAIEVFFRRVILRQSPPEFDEIIAPPPFRGFRRRRQQPEAEAPPPESVASEGEGEPVSDPEFEDLFPMPVFDDKLDRLSDLFPMPVFDDKLDRLSERLSRAAGAPPDFLTNNILVMFGLSTLPPGKTLRIKAYIEAADPTAGNYCPVNKVSQMHVYAPLDDVCIHCGKQLTPRSELERGDL